MNTVPEGLLVVIEGIDGAGKTTQAALIAQYFGGNGYPCLLSKEPTNRKWGRKLRESAASGRLTVEDELALFIKDRKDHVKEVIRPGLAAGHVVILDRYFFSTAAYQGEDEESVREILSANESFAPEPDLLIILDVDPTVGIGRIRSRGDRPNAFEGESSLIAAREIFRAIEDRSYARLIDGNRSIGEVSKEVMLCVQSAVMKKISGHLGLSKEALNETLKLFGGDSIPLKESGKGN